MTPRPPPTPLTPLQATLASLTGLLSAGLLAVPATESQGSEPTVQVVWAIVTLPGLIMPLVYLRVFGWSRAAHARVRPGDQLLAHTLLIPVMWGGLTVAVTCLQMFGIGIFAAIPAYTTTLELASGAQLPAPLFWTPLIGSLIRLAGERTISPLRGAGRAAWGRRLSPALFLLLGLALTWLNVA